MTIILASDASLPGRVWGDQGLAVLLKAVVAGAVTYFVTALATWRASRPE